MPEPQLPPPTAWDFSRAPLHDGEDLVAVGADLGPGTLLSAYCAGLFPMGIGDAGGPPLGWWSPDPRGILLPAEVHVSRSLRRSVRRFRVTVDQAFGDVVTACADPSREGAWITDDIREAYTALHDMGWAHSIECWDGADLVGGLYGVGIGGLFAAESMFHHATDAGKVAVVALCHVMGGVDGSMIDVQWRTDHLATLGVREIPREAYLARLDRALQVPPPAIWAGGGTVPEVVTPGRREGGARHGAPGDPP